MAFIGNTVQTQGFTPAIDYFNGNGVTVTFTLSRPVASVAQMIVAVDNVIQNPSSSFTVSGSSITFTSAPLSGTNNIWVEYTSLITTYAAISQDPSVIGDITASGGYLSTGDFGNSYIDGTIVDYVTGNARITTGPSDDMTFYHGGTASRSEMMSLYYVGGAKIYGTTALTIPVGTTAQRPGTPAAGMTRFNTSYNAVEYYNGTSWVFTSSAPTYSASYLVVSGGGGGGSTYGGGGGGAGGYLTSSTSLAYGTTYVITIGAGGGTGTNGNTSTLGLPVAITPVGGGAGGNYGTPGSPGASGGSGGGGGSCDINGTSSVGGTATSGQGFAGGTGGRTGGPLGGGGGGGGGAVGASWYAANAGGAGGIGITSSITGTSVYYAGGGGGGGGVGAGGGAGGNGGGGAGVSSGTGTAGTANTGGGGGGGGDVSSAGGAGGSGVVILSVPTASYSGTTTGSPTITTSGANTIIKFTASGTYTA
jgi:hypothetical protein